MIDIVYSYLRTQKSDRERVCETMYYLDQLLAIAKNVVRKGSSSKDKSTNVMTTEDRKKMLEVMRLRNIALTNNVCLFFFAQLRSKILKLLPLHLKKILFKHKMKPNWKPLSRRDLVEILKNCYVDHLELQSLFHSYHILSGIHIMLIQTYFAVVKMLPDCTYEDFINAMFKITAGKYSAIDRSLLSALLSQETTTYLMLNSDLQKPETREHCLIFAEPVNELRKYLILENENNIFKDSAVISIKKPINYIPAMASQVTVMSIDEKRLQKKLNKKQKRGGEIRELEEDLEKVQMKPLFKKIADYKPTERYDCYPHVHMENSGGQSKSVIGGKMLLIPSHSVRKVEEKYEEITIEASGRVSKRIAPSVKVSQLDPIGQMVFHDIKEFNEIQCEVFPVAYQSNENMLICAPTGAGKTNIALMTIVHQIKNFVEDKVLHLEQFKIVYICPMKALAAEITRKFSLCLSHLGVKVKEVSGDMQLSRKEIMETQILVTTPEKWDVITRKGAGMKLCCWLVTRLIINPISFIQPIRK